MSTLSNPTLWRTKPYQCDVYAYVLNPAIVFSCSVNQTLFTEPQANIAYDTVTIGAFADVEPGMKVRVKSSSGAQKGWAYVRKAWTSDTAYLVPLSFGEFVFIDNDILEVLDLFEPHARTPYINPATGEVFKNYDVAFNASLAQPPVANAGPWFAKRLQGASSLDVALDGTASFPVHPGATITAYSWNIKDGSVVSGSTSSATLTASFPDGYRWVSLTVTDSGSRTHTTYKLVVTTDDVTAIEVMRLGSELEAGWECSLTLLEDDVSSYPPGTAVMLWNEERYGSTNGSLNGVAGYEHIQFAGWSTDEVTVIEPYRSDYTLNAKNIQAFVAELPGYSQTTLFSSAPSSWFDVASHNMWRHLLNVLQWQTNLLELAEIERPAWYDDFSATGLDADAVPVGEQLHFMANAVRARFTADHNGIIYFRHDPHLMPDGERAALGSIVTLGDRDWTEQVDIPVRHHPRVGSVTGSGIVASTSTITAVMAGAPGTMPGRGGSHETLDRQLVSGQADMNSRTGRLYAKLNIDTPEINIQIMHGGMIADPAWQEWVRFTQAAASNKRSIGYSSQRFVLSGTEVEYEHQTGMMAPIWTLSKIADDIVGLALSIVMPGAEPPSGEDYIPDDGTWDDQLPYDWDAIAPEPYVPIGIEEPIGEETPNAVAWFTRNQSFLVRTSNWFDTPPTWSTITLPNSGGVVQVVALPGSFACYVLQADRWLNFTANIMTTNPSMVADTGALFNDLMRLTKQGGVVIRRSTSRTAPPPGQPVVPSGDTVMYYFDSTTLSSPVTLSGNPGNESAFDVDDYGLGVVILAHGRQVKFATSYDCSSGFTTMSGLTGVTGSSPDHITTIRIPFLKTTGVPNNNKASFEFYYSIFRVATYRVLYNLNTNTVISVTNISATLSPGGSSGVQNSPDTSTSHTAGAYDHNFETYGGNANRMMARMRNASTNGMRASTNGGASWSSINAMTSSNITRHVHAVEPTRGGNGSKWLVVSGGTGQGAHLDYTEDFGATSVSKSSSWPGTGDLTPTSQAGCIKL